MDIPETETTRINKKTDLPMIRILLAEDHNIVRSGIKNLLERERNFEVVGEATNGEEALRLLTGGLHADIVLADMNMPGMGGLELAEKLKKMSSTAKVIVLTMIDHEKYVIKAFNSGVTGYLLKNVGADELVFAINHIHGDGHYICSELALRFMGRLAQLPEPPEADDTSDVEFTKREMEVLLLTAEGYTNQEIAEKLFTSKRTVEGHRQSMINKTGTRNTIALIRYALKHGIIN
ncbi:MAG TPA: response regulator transcription factor [Mucilaginibacter sp.]|nr:response regulator transcription factor [Mucilaginibacter sp.]